MSHTNGPKKRLAGIPKALVKARREKDGRDGWLRPRAVRLHPSANQTARLVERSRGVFVALFIEQSEAGGESQQEPQFLDPQICVRGNLSRAGTSQVRNRQCASMAAPVRLALPVMTCSKNNRTRATPWTQEAKRGKDLVPYQPTLVIFCTESVKRVLG